MDAQVTESAKMFEFLAWLETNRSRIITVASAVVVLFLAVSYYRYSAHQREIKANQALFKLGLPMSRDEQATPPSANAYLKVAEQYSGTQAGERAQLMAAGTLFSDNNYAGAFEQFRKFTQQYPNSSLNPIAAFGVATCLDAQDKTDDALKAYQDLAARYASDATSQQSKLSMARIYETKKQPELALKIYDELGRMDNAGLSIRNDATERRQALLEKYPQLAPTNAAPAISVSPASTPTSLIRTATNATGASK
jgi:predicted negative regulator of RcsB-dependent stress response